MRQSLAEQLHPHIDVLGAVLDQPVGVEDQLSTDGQIQFGSLERHAAEPQRRPGRKVGEVHSAVGVDQCGEVMPRAGHGAVSGDGIVDRIQAGRSDDPDTDVRAPLFPVDTVDEVVEVAEELIGRQIERGEVVHRGAESPHGCGGVQSMADDITHDQSDAVARQRDHIEPVTADSRLCGQIAVGDIQGVLLGQSARQQAALQHDRQGVFAGVPAGVVDADRGTGDQLLGE